MRKVRRQKDKTVTTDSLMEMCGSLGSRKNFENFLIKFNFKLFPSIHLLPLISIKSKRPIYVSMLTQHFEANILTVLANCKGELCNVYEIEGADTYRLCATAKEYVF